MAKARHDFRPADVPPTSKSLLPSYTTHPGPNTNSQDFMLEQGQLFTFFYLFFPTVSSQILNFSWFDPFSIGLNVLTRRFNGHIISYHKVGISDTQMLTILLRLKSC